MLPVTSPWSIARRTKLQPEKLHSMTRKVTKYIVKDMAPLCTISSPHFREMLDEFDNRWKAPNRDTLANTLIPSWYDEEKSKLIRDIARSQFVAITSDGWTSVATDHFLTFTAHFIVDWKLLSRVLRTKAVFVPQTGENVAVEIEDCLADFGLKDKVSMITVDNAANMEVAAEKAGIMKLGGTESSGQPRDGQVERKNMHYHFLVQVNKHGESSAPRKAKTFRPTRSPANPRC